MSPFVVPLDSADAAVAVVGGKAAGLARLLRAGMLVPEGAVVVTAAYCAFVEANALCGAIGRLASRAAGLDPVELEAAAQAVGDLFARGSIPEEIAAEIRAVGIPPPYAVRSSATAEDLLGASFAGQYATFLNVRGEEELLQAVQRCWSSLWTSRALAYGARRGTDPSSLRMAVVVQRMVPADTAGVLYTVDPVSGDPAVMVIEASWGLGEAVVSGRVTPDTLVVDRTSGRIRRQTIGDKSVRVVPGERGTVEVAVAARRRPALRREEVDSLVRLGISLETCLGSPQDLEWAIAGGRVFLLQARPVSGLPAGGSAGAAAAGVPGDDRWPALGERPAQPFDLWTQANVGEVWPRPVSPLVWSGLPEILGDAIRASLRGLGARDLDDTQWTGRFFGRVYYNEGALAHLLSSSLGLPGSLVDAALGSGRAGTRRRDGGFLPHRLVRRLPFLVQKTVSQLTLGRKLEGLFPRIDHWVTGFLRRDLEPFSDGELWGEMRLWMERWKEALHLQFEISNVAMTSFSLLGRLSRRWLGEERLAEDLVSGLNGVFAAEMGVAVWRMARSARALGLAEMVLDRDANRALARLRTSPEAAPVMAMLTAFLERHGHRCANEGEWLYPRWIEAPEQVVEIMAGYVRAGDQVDLESVEAQQRARRAGAVARVEDLGPLSRRALQHVVGRAQHAVRLRDNGKHYYMKVSFPMRRIAALYGERWKRRGWLQRPEDIFFLAIPDLERIIDTGDPGAAGLDLPALVAARRAAFEHWHGVEAPEVVDADGRAIASDKPQPGGERELRGIAASGGLARGPARIVHDLPQACRLQPGEILVTRATDPGWTLVFPLVSGLVLEIGGQLSHAAIVAREYGIPAVVGVEGATRRLRDGETVTVDGSQGHVLRHEGQSAPPESRGR